MPAERGIDDYNRKDYYSVVLQVVVREDMRFTGVSCTAYYVHYIINEKWYSERHENSDKKPFAS